MTDPIRLSKRLAELLPCSRREAELYIQGGWVLVDGQVVEEPQFKVAGQKIELLPGATPTPLPPVTLLLHLPAGASADTAQRLLGADSHWADDPAAIRMHKGHFARLTQALPIEPRASGLLVFSQDWRTLRKLNEDAAKLEQEYVVEVSGERAAVDLQRLNQGLLYRGRPLPRCKVSWQSENRLRFALKNPQPGQLAHMCASVGLKVLGVKRIRIGGVPMAKLPVGQWRYVAEGERF